VSDAVKLLSELIAIPSVNPMGRDLSGPQLYEGRVTAYLEDFFNTLGVPCEKQRVAEGRENIFARLEGRGKRTVMLEAHQDTVPTDGMVIDPFHAVVQDGRLYGRGACDVKGGMAAMLAAFSRLARERPDGAPTVIMACTMDEEFTSTGVLALTTLWTDQAAGPDSLLADVPDMAVVAEPTNLDIVTAHKGAVRWKIRTTGRACHSSRPEEGVNAIYRMAKVAAALERYAAELPGQVPEHPLCGGATINVGRIEGGLSANTVPDECLIEIDRRILPGEEALPAREAVGRFLQAQPEIDFEVEMLEPWLCSPSLPDDANGEAAELLAAAAQAVRARPRIAGVTYGSDASKLALAGLPSVVFGPGSAAQAHTVDEWVPVDELEQAAEILYQFLRKSG
jgi:succinyl-diaminopimelate desuccinylase